jgi:chromate transport protein ChrA
LNRSEVAAFGLTAPPAGLTAPPALAVLFVALWCLHYLHRAVVYPLRRHMSPTTLPVVASAVCFNLVNGYLVGSEVRARGPTMGFMVFVYTMVGRGATRLITG